MAIFDGSESKSEKDVLVIRLNGPFSITTEDGTDFTPPNRKAQALVALVATSENLRRMRPWLQDKLWSQSAGKQGGASLRQTLTTIRNALKTKSDALLTTRLDVGLDRNKVRVEWEKGETDANDSFLEGLDVDDPEFEEWLRVMRRIDRPGPSIHSAPVFEAPHWKVAVLSDAFERHKPVVQRMSDTISRVLREQREMELADSLDDRSGDRILVIRMQEMHAKGAGSVIRLTAEDRDLNRQIWAENWTVPDGPVNGQGDLEQYALVFRLQTALTRYMAKSKNLLESNECPPLILGAAIPRIFSFQPSELDRAAKMLDETMDSHVAAQYFGWRAQIAVINLIEQFTTAPEACIERGKMFAAKAIELDPVNSVVLSTAANAQVLLDRGNPDSGAELAHLAVRVNPANPFAWWAQANVAIYAGDASKALQTARVASRLARRTPLQFWCDFQLGLAALKSGDIVNAQKALETSAVLAPQFRPPRRYLLALYAHRGEFQKAARVLVQLKKLEPDFSLDQFVNDPVYPVSLARKENMLVWSKFKDLPTAN